MGNNMKPKSDRMPSAPPRLSIEIEDHQKEKLDEYIPWGVRRRIFSVIIDDLITILEDEETRRIVLGGLLTRNIKLTDFLQVKGN